MRGRSIFNPRPVYLPTCRPADLPTIQNIHTWLFLYYILRGVSIFSSWSVYVSTCRPADQPLILHIHTLAYDILNHIPLYLPTCRATSYSMFYIYLYLTLYLSICRPDDPSLILILNIDKPLCMYIKDERWVGGSAGWQGGT